MFKYLLIIFLLCSCTKKEYIYIKPTINYERLKEIRYDCNNNTYGICIEQLYKTIEQHNLDKVQLKNYLESF